MKNVLGPKPSDPRSATKKVIIGKGRDSAGLVTANRKALFVSRFATSVSCSVVKDIVEGLDVSSVEVKQLKTKHPTYNSFYVLVNDTDFASANKDDAWPVGVLISPFYSSPKGLLLEEIRAVEDSAQVIVNKA